MVAKVYEMDFESKIEGNLIVCFFNVWFSRGVIYFNIKKLYFRDIRVIGYLVLKLVVLNY